MADERIYYCAACGDQVAGLRSTCSSQHAATIYYGTQADADEARAKGRAATAEHIRRQRRAGRRGD